VLHALEGPPEQLLERPRRVEVHRRELLGKARHAERWSHGTLAYACERRDERVGEPAVEARALRGAREQRGDGGGQGMLGHLIPPASVGGRAGGGGRERLIQVREDVVDVLDADAETDAARADARR